MKKQFRQITKCTAWAMFFASVLCCVSAFEINAQKTKPKPQPHEEMWYLTFDVTIKGTGEKRTGTGDELIQQWSIDREYSGVIELNVSVPTSIDVSKSMSPSEIMARVNSAPMMWLHIGKDVASSFLFVKVKIHDSTFLALKERGEGDTFEKTHHVTYWDGEGTAIADNGVQLILDKNKSLYNVTIPLQLHLEDRLLKKTGLHVVDRTDHGYGDGPTHEDIPVEPEDLALGTFGFPKVIGLLVGGKIHHPNNLPLKLGNGSYEWDSGDLDIDEPIFKGIPESKKGVKVHIYYLFKKVTGN